LTQQGSAVISTNPAAATPTWSTPTKIDEGGGLTSVSCASTALCVAVDSCGNALISANRSFSRLADLG
jgi:hypothetical protein